MPAEVVSLHGDTREGDPDPEIVEKLEVLLKRAKAGEITGLAFCTTHPGGSAGSGWSGIFGTAYSLAGAILLLQQRYSRALADED